ncbi:MAG: transcription termination/antitermination NusG family protein [Prevotellaceae bacterium]|nr:transcription termination/antitermination NusG family protein [Prevotellaceae bacterium]
MPEQQTQIIKNNRENSERRWYVGIVSSRSEKKTVEALERYGFKAFAAIHKEERTWSQGRKRQIDVVVIPAKIFIFCTDKERHSILDGHIGVLRFMVNIAGQPNEYGFRPLAVIPTKQIEALQQLLNSSKHVEYTECYYVKGDNVRVISGVLKGYEGVVCRDAEGGSRLYIVIDGLGSAYTEIDAKDTELIKD